MFTGWVLISIVAVTILAVVANLAFFYMQSRIAEKGYRPKYFKTLKDIFEVYSRYRQRIALREVPGWPATVFLTALGGVVVYMFYIVVSAFVYSHQ